MWSFVWESAFGGIGVSISEFFNRRDYYNNHPIGHLQVLLARRNAGEDSHREIYYHDLMNAYPIENGNEWNVYHVNLSFY